MKQAGFTPSIKLSEGATLWQGQGHVELTALLVSFEACKATVAGASKVIHCTQFTHGKGDDDDVVVVADEGSGGLWRILIV